jgi:hypothetical protein
VLAAGVLSSCKDEKYPKYSLSTKEVIPEEAREKYTEFIIRTVSAASHRMTTCDYEDPEDLVRQAEQTAFNLYSKEIQVLKLQSCKNCMSGYIEPSNFSEYQKQVFDSFQNNR